MYIIKYVLFEISVQIIGEQPIDSYSNKLQIALLMMMFQLDYTIGKCSFTNI